MGCSFPTSFERKSRIQVYIDLYLAVIHKINELRMVTHDPTFSEDLVTLKIDEVEVAYALLVQHVNDAPRSSFFESEVLGLNEQIVEHVIRVRTSLIRKQSDLDALAIG